MSRRIAASDQGTRHPPHLSRGCGGVRCRFGGRLGAGNIAATEKVHLTKSAWNLKREAVSGPRRPQALAFVDACSGVSPGAVLQLVLCEGAGVLATQAAAL